jgi:hypothetical protein
MSNGNYLNRHNITEILLKVALSTITPSFIFRTRKYKSYTDMREEWKNRGYDF